MKKIFLLLLSLVLLFTITGCGSKKEQPINNPPEEPKQEEKQNDSNQGNANNGAYIEDDEIIDIDDEDNEPIDNERITVSQVINCDGCVYAYFNAEGDNAKKIGDTISENEYTTDINTIRTSGNKQRHNFFGLVLSGNTIGRAYACILKDNKIYCLEGSTNGAYHTNNISILNQVFSSSMCKTISDGNTYTCSDGSYNGDTKTNGYTSMHYETSCTIYGANSNTGKLICH